MFSVFRPQLIESLRGYSREMLLADAMAGVTVGIIALPLALALAIASGLEPRAGLWTAIVAGFVISALGGSRVQIGGPTGAFVAIVYGVVIQHGVANLLVCTFLAGAILVMMGLARMGRMIKFIPYPVTTGFTSGIAVLILSTQVKDFLGLKLETVPGEFIERVVVLASHLSGVNGVAVLFSVGCFLMGTLWPARLARRVPGSVIALVLATVAGAWLGVEERFGLETIGSRFGGIPQELPTLAWPSVDWGQLPVLLRASFTIALLGAIESLLCAVVADGMTEDRHDSNQELMAQGLANMGAAMVGGMPATGAIARTAANVRSGGRTPVAGLIHAMTLLGVVLVAAPLAKHIPLAALSAVLVRVALNMGEWHQFRRLGKWPRSDSAVFLVSFGLTVLVDLTVAVEVGMVLAALLFIKRIADTTHVARVDASSDDEPPQHSLRGRELPPGVMVYTISGAFFFGAADKLETALQRSGRLPPVLILRLHRVLAMDATGLNALEDLSEKVKRHGSRLLISGAHTQPLIAMQSAGLVQRLGEENLLENLETALARAGELLSSR